jgi:sugar phosphate isomerase/epimerase
MMITRRSFGQMAVSGLASAATLLAAKKIPIAVQLYSVRQIAKDDLAGVLKEVARIGYKGVEFAGYYNHDAAELRKMLDGNGLKVAGTHIALDTLLGDNLAPTLEFNKTIGNQNLIVPSMPAKYRSSIEGWKEAAGVFEEIAQKVKPQGFVLGYHNHTAEFETKDGQLPFNVFFDNAKDVKVQLDIGHAARAGANPEELIRKYKGRVISVHIKEFSPTKEEAVLGEGSIDWKKVFRALETVGGTEWYIVEEEGKNCSKFECIERSYNILTKKMGKG